MSINRFKLKLISPAFIAGSDKNAPEMRASSVRGQLRYWLRAIIGAKSTDLAKLRELESAIFGSTAQGSAVSVRVYRDNPAKIGEFAMLPHRMNEGRRMASHQVALNAGQLWDLELVTRPGVPMSGEALNALMVWSLLGGIGRRSRRMFGAVEIMPKADEGIDWYHLPQSPDDFMTILKGVLGKIANGQAYSSIPNFPTLNPAHAWVIVCKERFDNQEDALVALFKLLRSDEFRLKQDTFGGISPRRSSPLIAQVRRVGKDNYYPILTAMRSKPDSKIDWVHLKKLMDKAGQIFNGETVWGGW